MIRAVHKIALVLGGILLATGPAFADWSGFYRPTQPPRPAPALSAPAQVMGPCGAGIPALSAIPSLEEGGVCGVELDAGALSQGAPPPVNDPQMPALADLSGPDGVCLSEIMSAQLRYAIPNNLLLAIGLREAGLSRGGRLTVWPWSVNADGAGRFLTDREAAIAYVRERQGAGAELIDIGCMQVNLRWHPDAFPRLEDGFDPALNVDYAARFLVRLHAETGDWRAAAGRYHSADPERSAVYLSALEANLEVANGAVSAAELRIDPEAAAALAALPDPSRFNGDLDAYLTSLVTDEPVSVPKRRPLWSAGLGAADAGDRVYGIYSASGLRPVLPAFTQDF
jgi:hypothetical protein